MNLLLFSDLHCDAERAQALVRRSREVDVVVCAGDLGNVRRGLAQTIAVLKAIDKPTVLVPGNNESASELIEAARNWPSAVVLHGSGTQLTGVEFFGLGGGVPITPFGDWSFDLTEENAAKLLEACPKGAVLVSHSPPQGVLDVTSSGKSLGSSAVRQAIERCQPKLVVCGHIHACGGQMEMIGETMVINAGPEGIEWELPNG
ncbi:MAG TPA: metallophosphoesterase family protein [Pirellulaceae bacterium]|nr:metallophosphoesterase family protein [Pirellulaceae bacterium]